MWVPSTWRVTKIVISKVIVFESDLESFLKTNGVLGMIVNIKYYTNILFICTNIKILLTVY